MTPAQSRAARGLLEWSQADLARASSLSESTIRDFEKGRRTPNENNLKAIAAAFDKAGVVLIDDGSSSSVGGAGARFREASPTHDLHAQYEHLNAVYEQLAIRIKSIEDEINSLDEKNIAKRAALIEIMAELQTFLAKTDDEIEGVLYWIKQEERMTDGDED